MRDLHQDSGFKTALTVNKTDVSPSVGASPTSTDETERKDSDPARYCPIHKKTHPLVKCRTFRMKTLQERKNILKENKRCFKCCSPNHLARECQAILKCSECESERHCSAMHPDTVQPTPPSPKPEPDLEPQSSTSLEVTSRCTKVCGVGNLTPSCVLGTGLPSEPTGTLHQDVCHS